MCNFRQGRTKECDTYHMLFHTAGILNVYGSDIVGFGFTENAPTGEDLFVKVDTGTMDRLIYSSSDVDHRTPQQKCQVSWSLSIHTRDDNSEHRETRRNNHAYHTPWLPNSIEYNVLKIAPQHGRCAARPDNHSFYALYFVAYSKKHPSIKGYVPLTFDIKIN